MPALSFSRGLLSAGTRNEASHQGATNQYGMSDDLRSRLISAATAGEIIRVIYHRGSQPGTVREIAPVGVTDEEVRARDLAAGIDKAFKLAHLELAGS